MDKDAKRTALRMIPYGLYVLTGDAGDNRVTAAAVTWVTQASFTPPLLSVGVKIDSGGYAIIKEAEAFAINVLGKDQAELATTFFKSTTLDGENVNGEPFHRGTTGAPILDNVPAYLECKLVDTLERGDHAIFLGEVVGAGVQTTIEGRPDAATLTCADVNEKIFYGG